VGLQQELEEIGRLNRKTLLWPPTGRSRDVEYEGIRALKERLRALDHGQLDKSWAGSLTSLRSR
jgi:hypothetical protein